MSDIAAFITARLDEFAEIASGHPCRCDNGLGEPDGHPRPDCPKWVLADVDAKRRIIAELQGSSIHNGYWPAYHYALQCLALPYADHPDYNQDWRP